MELFYRNPLTIILFRTIYPDLNLRLKAFYIPDSRSPKNLNRKSRHIKAINKVDKYQLVISKLIGDKMNISIHTLSSEKLPTKNSFVDTLPPSQSDSLKLIFQPSDIYCSIGFDSYFRYMRKKIKLKYLWNKGVNFKHRNGIYLFDHGQFHKNRSNIEPLNIDLARSFLNLAQKSVLSKIVSECKLKIERPFLLVLPPSEHSNPEFFDAFFLYCIQLAKNEDLKIFIKPHRHDLTDYKTKFTDKMFIQSFNSNIKYMPTEFLLNMDSVKKIIAIPSSSFAFVDPKKTTIICPKNRKLFGKQYLDQTIFMKHLGLNYIVI